MTENNPMDTALEQAVTEIRDETIDDAVIEAAAARVWVRLAGASEHHIRGCADFQSLIPEYRAGRLTAARARPSRDGRAASSRRLVAPSSTCHRSRRLGG